MPSPGGIHAISQPVMLRSEQRCGSVLVEMSSQAEDTNARQFELLLRPATNDADHEQGRGRKMQCSE